MNNILSFLGGVVVTVVGFILTHNHPLRNRITGEFRIRISLDSMNGSGYDDNHRPVYTRIRLICEFNYTGHEVFRINYLYCLMPRTFRGNSKPNATLGEQLHGEEGRFYFHVIDQEDFQHSRFIVIDLEDRAAIDALCNRRGSWLRRIFTRNCFYIQLVVNTSRFGDVKSNNIKIRYTPAY